MSDTELSQLSATQLRDAIAAKNISAREAVLSCLDRIDAHNGELNACTQTFAERALEKAHAVDAGEITGPLAGVPIAVKDNICTSFGRTTCASRMLENYQSPFDATAVRKLENAGAIILAKTNLDEFAMGSTTERSIFGPTRNPFDPTRSAGGSSGGSAAAIASGMCFAALGSDTGGSVRQPASFCGLTAVKPTYGSVSRYGLIAYASSLEQIAPIAQNVRDCALLLSVIAGHDPHDSTSHVEDYPDYTSNLGAKIDGLRIGIAHREGMESAIRILESRGGKILDIELPHERYAADAYYVIAMSEASSNLARFDGVRFGHRATGAQTLEELYTRSRSEGFGDEVKKRIMLGIFALSAGYYDAWYLRAAKVRRLIRQDFDDAFRRCDAIIGPVTRDAAYPIGYHEEDPMALYLNDLHTVSANLSGLPALVIPQPFQEENRHPTGLQIMGPPWSENRLFRIATALSAT